MTASVEGLAAEPAAVAKLRGKMSRRAESAYFNEWDARAVVEYIDALASQPKNGELLALADRLTNRSMEQERFGFTDAGRAVASLCSFVAEVGDELRTLATERRGAEVTDEMVERVLNTRIPGGSQVWHSIEGGGMQIENAHRVIARRVIEAFIALQPSGEEG